MLQIVEHEKHEKLIIPHTSTINDALCAIDANGLGACLVSNASNCIVGLITDGDIRRGFLNGVTAVSPIDFILKKYFYYVKHSANWKSDAEFMLLMHAVKQIPILNHDGTLHEFVIFTGCRVYKAKDNPVVIMAGGLGERLRPLTENCPKPLLPVGSRPLLERIIAYFRYYGFRKFYISINYLGEMISDHFQDGRAMGVEIEYLREQQRGGTAGSLLLLPKLLLPFIVTNGDLLMHVDLEEFITTHVQKQFLATMCVRSHAVRIPYGVVNVDEDRFIGITEKPGFNFLINTGLYSFNPSVLDFISDSEFVDMPTLFERIVKANCRAGVFMMEGKWIDIGNIDDYNMVCNNDIIMI